MTRGIPTEDDPIFDDVDLLIDLDEFDDDMREWGYATWTRPDYPHNPAVFRGAHLAYRTAEERYAGYGWQHGPPWWDTPRRQRDLPV